MTKKPIIKTQKIKSFSVVIQYVFRANFNDTYFLEEIIIDLATLNLEELTWFDPYNGRSKFHNTQVAVAYVSDEKFVILQKKNEDVVESEHPIYSDCILCEDFDKSLLLAAHIRVKT